MIAFSVMDDKTEVGVGVEWPDRMMLIRFKKSVRSLPGMRDLPEWQFVRSPEQFNVQFTGLERVMNASRLAFGQLLFRDSKVGSCYGFKDGVIVLRKVGESPDVISNQSLLPTGYSVVFS